MTQLWKLGVRALGKAYRRGETDPVEVTRCLVERIGRIDPTLNAFARLAPELEAAALDSARRLKAGEARSPLEGVPLAIKDNLSVAGMPAAWGSSVFEGVVRLADELPIARLRAGGALFLGKTNTPEFAVEGYTASALFGVTGNPWNPTLTPGGSSGGSVAAVAAGLAAAGLGTDGGGSIRRPAGHTGLFGLKPTIGTVPRHGGLPQVLLDFEVVGCVARGAGDLAPLLDVLAGGDRRDPSSRFAARSPRKSGPWRILYVERFDDNPCDPAIRSSVGAAAARLEAMGHHIETGSLPFDLAALNAFWPRFGQIGLAHLEATMPEMAHASGKYRAMALEGSQVSASELYAALEEVRALRAATSAFFGSWDAIMTPSAAAQPWPADQAFPPLIDGAPVGPRGHAVYTGWVNAAGLPAINLPADPDPGGLPVGFQVVGDYFTEGALIELGQAYEGAGAGWRWPEIAL